MSPVKRATRQFFFFFLMVLYLSILTSDNHHIVALCFAAYGIGSIPFGYLLTRLSGQDVRKIGSGNIGATNVLRTGDKKSAALTLLLDAFKGWLSVTWLAPVGTEVELTYVIGLFTVIGHLYPLWLDFRGGKGVATGFGILLALNWPIALAGAAVWFTMAFWLRISSLAALVAYASVPVLSLVFVNQEMAWFSLALAALIFICHKNNIQRLLVGKEPKIGH